MEVLKKIKQFKTNLLSSNSLSDIFGFLLTEIESSKGNLHLANIFELISDELQRNNINSIICIINDKRDEVMVRHVSFPGEFKKIFTTENVRAINFKKFTKYQEVIKKKRAIFCDDRLSQFQKVIPQTSKIFEKNEKTNAIITPLVLRGELIGTIEILSPVLKLEDVLIIEKFVKKLVISITNNILFHEIRESEQRYRDLFANSSDGLIFFDIKEKCFRESNIAMRKLSGYTIEELKQIHYLRLFEKDSRDNIKEIVELLKEDGEVELPLKLSAKIRTKNKEIKICNIEIGVQEANGEVCFSFSDITRTNMIDGKIKKSKSVNIQIMPFQGIPATGIFFQDRKPGNRRADFKIFKL